MLILVHIVALRKESVDRNARLLMFFWLCGVALRKESVDRNNIGSASLTVSTTSLSARRAWIEIQKLLKKSIDKYGRSPQGERG